jgi:hypothetical protein
MDESDLHSEKYDEPRMSTLHEIIIDRSHGDESASNSIRINCEIDSNEMDESDLHARNHDEPRISISDGIII